MTSRRVEVIAELGVNHDGSLHKAMELASAAAAAGADVIKTQDSEPELETSRHEAPDHLDMIRSLMLSHDDMEVLAQHVTIALGKEFMCTPAEEVSLERVSRLVKRIKVSSDNLTNHEFLNAVALHGLPVVLSTGMADMHDVGDAFYTLNRHLPADKITVLHCTSAYPCPADQVNLMAMPAIAHALGVRVGFSDHTTSVVLPAVAVALGATVIEKHVTLDAKAKGPDHGASLEPHQFAAMVDGVREAEKALGDGEKVVQPCEQVNRLLVRKSVAARRAIKAGDVLDRENLCVLRPGNGIPAASVRLLYGRRAILDYAAGELLKGREL
jgi:N,N'-diacetyllegionaminate synthase